MGQSDLSVDELRGKVVAKAGTFEPALFEKAEIEKLLIFVFDTMQYFIFAEHFGTFIQVIQYNRYTYILLRRRDADATLFNCQ